MTHFYEITGMTCNSCVAKVKNELLKIGDITETDVQLASPQARISMEKHIPTSVLQQAIHKAGNYTITDAGNSGINEEESSEEKTGFGTYQPLLLIAAYITGISFLLSAATGRINWMQWMNIFMSGFFLVFSFFKLLNLRGFAQSYQMYDIVAKRFPAWGYIYAFIELLLGVAYAIHYEPVITNAVTFIIMSVSLIGVLQSVLNKRKIQCACLGTVFNLPMSTVTIVEDSAMIIMSGVMLAAYF